MQTFEAKNRKEWRAWLEKHHSDAKEIWLVYFKKHTNKPTITYEESVEEAICFGWIDGLKRRIDDERYAHRFSPRRKNSQWSPSNIAIAQKMINNNLITRSGLKAFNERKEYDPTYLQTRSSIAGSLPTELEQKLKSHTKAWNNFNNLTLGHRKQYILWINSAKKDTTKLKRLAEAISLLEKNEKLGMK